MKNNLIVSIPAVIKPHLPPILFVHGAWHGAWCWQEHFMPYFTEKGYRTYAFDLTHHGQFKDQPNINKIRVRDYVTDLENAIAEIGEPCVLIGHSMGGFIVQKYLEKKDCLGAVLMASIPRTGITRLIIRMCQFFPKAMVKMWFKMDLFQIVNTPKRVKICFFSEDYPVDELEKYTNKLGSESIRVMLLDLLWTNIKKRKNKEIPVLVQCAENDQIFSIKENEDTASFQNADYQLIPSIAHDLMLEEKWELAAKGILDWLTLKFPIPNNE